MLDKLLSKTREQRAASLAEAETILTKVATEKRSITEDESKRYAECEAAADAALTEEKRLVKLIADKASLSVPEGRKTSPPPASPLVTPERTAVAPRLLRSARVRNFKAESGVSAEERAHKIGRAHV